MKRACVLLALVAIMVDGCSAAPKGASPAPKTAKAVTPVGKLLTIADVEKVSGIKGLKLVPHDPSRGAGGELNFAEANGTLIVLLTTMPASAYPDAKSYADAFRADLPGIGDEAFEGPSTRIKSEPYTLTFRKGDRAFAMASFFDLKHGAKPFLTIAQLKKLAAIIVSRL
jgi:hypothetical protein